MKPSTQRSKDHGRATGWLPWLGGAALLVGALWAVRSTTGDDRSQPAAKRHEPAARTASERDARSVESATATPPRPIGPSDGDATTSRRDELDSPSAASPNEADPLAELKRAMADASASGTSTLIASLRSGDPVVVAEAAKALIARRATSAIGSLSEIDLSVAAGSGASIIDALGRLGGLAGARDKDAAVDRLIALLAEEKHRGARESAGNLLQIYEALGDTGDAKAAAPLEAELLDPEVGRAPKVVIVHALSAIGGSDRREAMMAARAQQVASPGTDAFDEEVRHELIAEIDQTLGALAQ